MPSASSDSISKVVGSPPLLTRCRPNRLVTTPSESVYGGPLPPRSRASKGCLADAPRVRVDHHSEVQPTLERPDVRDVGGPDLVRLLWVGLPIERVGCDRVVVFRVRGSPEASPYLRLDAVPAHLSLDTIEPNRVTVVPQLRVYSRTSLPTSAGFMNRTDSCEQLGISSFSNTRSGPATPGVQPATRDLEHSTHQRAWVSGLLRSDQLER